MGLGHDSVMILLYHRERQCVLLVRQFRPGMHIIIDYHLSSQLSAVFVQLVKSMQENAGKSLADVDWAAYPIELGNTLELCGGIMDKDGKSEEETAREEIEEECGYRVGDIQLIKKYL